MRRKQQEPVASGEASERPEVARVKCKVGSDADWFGLGAQPELIEMRILRLAGKHQSAIAGDSRRLFAGGPEGDLAGWPGGAPIAG